MTTDGEEPLLLDTHVWVWFVEGAAARLDAAAVRAVECSAARGALIASAISVWELALLVRKGRLALNEELRPWIDKTRRPPGVRIEPLSAEAALYSASLPDLDDHADPADRFLVATARSLGARLVTCDARLLRYGVTGNVLTLDARPS